MGLGPDTPEFKAANKWFYEPNKVGPIVFCILFSLSGVVHGYQTYKYKSWKVTGILPWSALLMTAGFACREAGAYHNNSLELVIASNALIMSGPPIYAVVDYLVLSRLLFYIPYFSPLHPGRVLTTFVGIDAIIEGVIVNGAVRTVNFSATEKTREVGSIMVKTALILQALMFFLFVLLAGRFQLQCERAKVLKPKHRTVLRVMYVSATIVTARCIYRIVEYFQGTDGEVYRHEAYFYVFEASIMFINTLILNIWHPGARLPQDNKVFLAKDGVTERRGPGWDDDRPWIVTVFDPFDLGSMLSGGKHTAFWELSDEELEALRLEKKNKKRPFYKGLLDPLHLYGRDGFFARKFGKGLSKPDGAEELASITTADGAKSERAAA